MPRRIVRGVFAHCSNALAHFLRAEDVPNSQRIREAHTKAQEVLVSAANALALRQRGHRVKLEGAVDRLDIALGRARGRVDEVVSRGRPYPDEVLTALELDTSDAGKATDDAIAAVLAFMRSW